MKARASRTMGSTICYVSACAVWLMAAASIFSRLAGIRLAYRGFVIPVDWSFAAMMAIGGLEVLGIGWIGNRAAFRRRTWLWLPLVVGGLALGFGLFVLYLALLRI